MSRRFGGRGSGRGGCTAIEAGHLELDGIDDAVSVASHASQIPSSDKMTLVGMIKVLAFPTTTAGVVGKGDYGVSSSYGLRVGSSDYPDALTASMATAANEIFGNSSTSKCGRYTVPPLNVYSQLGWTYDSSASGTAKSTIWVNTNPCAKDLYTGTHPADIITSTSAFEFGAFKALGVRMNFLQAHLWRWFLYDRVLSEAELRSHALGSEPSDFVLRFKFKKNGNDDGANGLTGTFVGGAGIVAGNGSKALRFLRIHVISDSTGLGQETSFHATEWRGGWRRLLSDDLAAEGVFVRGVGSLNTKYSYWANHDCVSGGLVATLFTNASGSASYTPDVVIVALGTNNARSGQPTSPSQTRADFATLMDNIYTGQSPYALLVPPCALPAETASGRVYIDGVNWFVKEELVRAQVALGRNVNACNPAYVGATHTEDDVHLNNAGNVLVKNAALSYVRSQTAYTTSPAREARATLRTVCALNGETVEMLYTGKRTSTELSGKISSKLDFHEDESGTNSHTMTQGTALARPVGNGGSDEYRAGQDDATQDALIMSAGDKISSSSGAYIRGIHFHPLYSPALDPFGGHAIAAYERGTNGHGAVVLIRTLDAGATFKIYFRAHIENTAGNVYMTIPYTHSLAWRRFMFEYNGGDPNLTTSYQAWLDGVAQAISTGASSQANIDYGTVGKFRIGAADYFFAGLALGEDVIISGSGSAQRTAMNNYLDATAPLV